MTLIAEIKEAIEIAKDNLHFFVGSTPAKELYFKANAIKGIAYRTEIKIFSKIQKELSYSIDKPDYVLILFHLNRTAWEISKAKDDKTLDSCTLFFNSFERKVYKRIYRMIDNYLCSSFMIAEDKSNTAISIKDTNTINRKVNLETELLRKEIVELIIENSYAAHDRVEDSYKQFCQRISEEQGEGAFYYFWSEILDSVYRDCLKSSLLYVD